MKPLRFPTISARLLPSGVDNQWRRRNGGHCLISERQGRSGDSQGRALVPDDLRSKREQPADAKAFDAVANKFEQYFHQTLVKVTERRKPSERQASGYHDGGSFAVSLNLS